MALKRMLSLALVICASSASSAAYEVQNDFADFKKKYQSKHKEYTDDYTQHYEAYKKELIEKWGVAELSSDTEYVTYSDDKSVKIIANFENDTIEVSIQRDAQGRITADDEKVMVRDAIIEALNVAPKMAAKQNIEFAFTPAKTPQTTLSSKIKKPAKKISLKQDTLLAHLGIEDGKELKAVLSMVEEVPAEKQQAIVVARTEKRLLQQIAQVDQFIEREELPLKQIKRAQGQVAELNSQLNELSQKQDTVTKKNIKSYKIQLKRDRFNKAEKYLSQVAMQANQWQVDQEVLLAIMETESHFNPMAKSHIPAYGLMQIVPSTAGADVNKKIFSINKNPTPELLFNGTKNIEYGSAYFNILMSRYLKEVENPTSRMYCAIAAYNTGIGNLARAFNNGERGRMKAINKINKMTPEQVFEVIKTKTHTETQRYLIKVVNSKNYFAEHI
ncbi:transglycosylase SLT domain-containing protein [Pseudoalteromonas sp. SWYJZ98]|uniref:transglycosylase SLT domain-containing protein n=1 Tax=Pseudoalteromonas sp. SWYJZ98 TaxID=2792060 RepID=UPI0018CD82DC|nr:transglycosylase SLT domain-containing protein [Pseudoalteromonas sp. SWYJZ98]MBH0030020.1 transglycosylase SLT domain-containing protein [Pseudoalteromonas sp. SWYJZ98]